MTVGLENGWMLLPGRTVAKGDVVIGADGRIAAVGPGAVAAVRGEGVCVRDCSETLVMPGFVNCHAHTAMTLLRGRGGGLPLQR